jgi:hypothetical protein
LKSSSGSSGTSLTFVSDLSQYNVVCGLTYFAGWADRRLSATGSPMSLVAILMFVSTLTGDVDKKLQAWPSRYIASRSLLIPPNPTGKAFDAPKETQTLRLIQSACPACPVCLA